jgi:hypothetical protein|tara:strand:- start:268 stop:558 length:291 start_codon:yes stop_codon:yes gene_type:complete
MTDKIKTNPQIDTEVHDDPVILHNGIAFLESLDEKTRNNVALLVQAVAKARVNGFVASELSNNLAGSEKALFNLGTVAGENNIIKQLKVILTGSAK